MSNDAKFKVKASDDTRKAFEALDKRLAKTKKESEGLTNKFKDLNRKGLAVNKALGSIAVAAGAWGIKNQIEESVAYADALAKTADKLGITTDALQEYRFAAQLNNVEQTALDTGLQRWTRRLGEAAKGQGELRQVLEDNNVSIRDSNGNLRNSEAVLADYADTIKGAGTDQEKLLLAFKAFDTEGAAMVNVLRDGSEGLEKLRQKARESGAVMDSELIRKAEIINDKWETLTHTIGIELKSALISVSSVFVDTASNAEKMEDILQKIKTVNYEIAHAAARGRTNFGGEIEHLKQLGEAYQKLKDIKNDVAETGGSAGFEETEKQKGMRRQAVADAFLRLHKEKVLKAAEEEAHEEMVLRLSANALLIQAKQAQEKEAAEAARQLMQDRLSVAQSMMSNLSTLMNSQNRKQFKLGKKAAVSHALMKGTSAALNSYEVGTRAGGPVLGSIFAATSAVATGVYIDRIRKRTFSGAREHGGPVSAGSLYKVNDGAGNPMELFQPNSSGQIISNKNISNRGDQNVSVILNMHPDSQIENWVDNNSGKLFSVILGAMNENDLTFGTR